MRRGIPATTRRGNRRSRDRFFQNPRDANRPSSQTSSAARNAKLSRETSARPAPSRAGETCEKGAVKATGSRRTVSRKDSTAAGNQKSLEYMSQATKMVANSSESEAELGLHLPAVAGGLQRTTGATAATDTH